MYVKAELGLNSTLLYTDDTGRYFRFSGGTWAWRNHNPGNLFPGKVSSRHNQIGSTGKLAIFPDYETGHLALIDCLQTTYINSSIDHLVTKFAPAKDGNNVKVYRKFLHDKTGVKDDKKVKDFSATEFDKLWRAIEQMEGYRKGTITEVFPVIQVHKNNTGIYDYHVKKKGWVTKPNCISMVEQGILDLIMCTSVLGHIYLRARVGSSINGSLNHLIIKNSNKVKINEN